MEGWVQLNRTQCSSISMLVKVSFWKPAPSSPQTYTFPLHSLACLRYSETRLMM